jgi:hypothetical protein
VFDDESLVSCAGLVPVMALAERAGLSELVAAKVAITETRVASAAVNPAGKVTSIIAGMAAGADSIDDLDVIRAGGMARLFDQVYAPATLGQFLREFTHGHTQQLAAVAREHLVRLAGCTGLLSGIERRALIDADRYRLAAAPGLRARQAGRELRTHQDRRPSASAARPVPAGDHLEHDRWCAGAGRHPATRRQGRIGTRCRLDAARGDRRRSCRRRHR